MTTNYSGNPANITTPLAATVIGTSSGTASRVRIQTSASHNYSTFDVVAVSGVVGTTEANTTAIITVIDATHFDMVGTTFANAYVSGGACSDLSLTPYGTLPNDGEPGSVAQIESFLQLLADRTQFLAGRSSPLGSQTFTADGSVYSPLGANWAIVQGIGGGGGGGGGQAGAVSIAEFGGGGGGGGGNGRVVFVPVVFGTPYGVAVGAGGAGGASASNGSDGVNSAFTDEVTFSIVFPGGQGGLAGAAAVGGAGGGPSKYSQPAVVGTYGPGSGGNGGTIGSGTAGKTGETSGHAGGAGGTKGTDTGGSHKGGSGGGGGGNSNSPFASNLAAASGGAGGNGANGSDAAGIVGSVGSAATANTGSGGGGGGAGGGSASAAAAGGAGGAGGSGKIVVFWMR